MTTEQAECIIGLLERIATALERANALDPMTALAEVLQPPDGDNDAPFQDAEAWRFE